MNVWCSPWMHESVNGWMENEWKELAGVSRLWSTDRQHCTKKHKIHFFSFFCILNRNVMAHVHFWWFSIWRIEYFRTPTQQLHSAMAFSPFLAEIGPVQGFWQWIRNYTHFPMYDCIHVRHQFQGPTSLARWPTMQFISDRWWMAVNARWNSPTQHQVQLIVFYWSMATNEFDFTCSIRSAIPPAKLWLWQNGAQGRIERQNDLIKYFFFFSQQFGLVSLFSFVLAFFVFSCHESKIQMWFEHDLKRRNLWRNRQALTGRR